MDARCIKPRDAWSVRPGITVTNYGDTLPITLIIGVEVWSYGLMPHHVHLVRVPADRDGLSRAVGEAHRRYGTLPSTR